MTLGWIIEPASTLRIVAIIASGYIILSSLEYLSARERLSNDDILDWEISKSLWTGSFVSGLLGSLLAYQRFLWLLVGRLVAGILVIAFAVRGELVPVVLAVVFITTLSISLRNPYGLDGGFQMSLVIFGGLFLGSLFPDGSLGQRVCLLFIAAQAVLSYFVAGVSKLSSDSWRAGTALTGIFGTSLFGHKQIHERLRRYPNLDTVGCWGTILFECMFPLVLIVDLRYASVFLIGGFLFHLATAVFMGLNGFLLTFIATYPAVVYANVFIQGLNWF
jgi:hypothetical protein